MSGINIPTKIIAVIYEIRKQGWLNKNIFLAAQPFKQSRNLFAFPKTYF